MAEEKQLNMYAKLAYSFFAGYLTSKIESLVMYIIKEFTGDNKIKDFMWMSTSIFACSLIVVFICTYVNRAYWLKQTNYSVNITNSDTDKIFKE